VQKLMRHGHQLHAIRDYTLDQLLIFLDAVERLEAVSRACFVTDMGVVVGSLFSKDNPLGTHLDSLRKTANGE
jgi:hypothetical protein